MSTVIITATRRIQFCAGHRVHNHGSKCRHMHGHNYVAFITVQAPELDKLGMVTDFAVIKEKLGVWIDEHWDHGFVYYEKDRAVLHALLEFQGEEEGTFLQKRYPLPYNPTAENMAQYLLEVGNNLFKGTEVKVVEVTLWETENCSATVKLWKAPDIQI